jgi:hypothetical protein
MSNKSEKKDVDYDKKFAFPVSATLALNRAFAVQIAYWPAVM